jgi:peptidoglycan/xylan/chitin deacetylase (PgdA/CDA1 family)
MLLRTLFGALSPAGAGARLSTLIFHRVLPKADPLFRAEVDAVRFDQICTWLARWFNVLPLDQAVRDLQVGSLPTRALAITFDDGYADNHDVALPILQRHGLNATFFVATGFLDGGRMWNDSVIEALRRCPHDAIDLAGTVAAELGRLPLETLTQRHAAISHVIGKTKYLAPAVRNDWVAAVVGKAGAPLPDDLMMTAGQVRALHRAGMGIGAHTVNHPILARLEAPQALSEIADGRAALQHIVDAPVTLFAYPNGKPGVDYGPEAVSMVRELGFSAAVSTAWGAARHGQDRFQLPRFTPWDRSPTRFGLRLASQMRAP